VKAFLAGFAAIVLSICAAVAAVPAGAAQKARDPSFLVHANVFNDRGFTVPNALVRMRRAAESNWRWKAVSDGEGEIALHVPPNDLYVLRVDAKGYQVLTQNVDATQTDNADIALHLAPIGGGKTQ